MLWAQILHVMEKSVIDYLLNGMPLNEFKSWLILAMGGAFVWFLIKLFIILGPFGPKSPKWSWRIFFRGILKLLITLIVAPWFILFFDDVAPVIFELAFNMGSENATGSAHQHITMELNGFSAAGLGFSIDLLTRKISNSKYFNKNGK